MDADGEVLTSNVSRSVADFERTAAALTEIAQLGKAEKEGKLEGDAAAKLLIARIDLGQVEFAEAKKRAAAIKGPVSDANGKELDGRLNDLEVAAIVNKQQQAVTPKRNELMQKMRGQPGGAQPTPEERREMSAKMLAMNAEMNLAVAADLQPMLDAGRRPTDKMALSFWMYVLRGAENRKDAKTIEHAKTELEALAERRPDQKAMIERVINPTAGGQRSVPATPLRAPGGDPKGDKKKGDGK